MKILNYWRRNERYYNSKKFSKEEIKFIKENYTGEKDNVINIAKQLNRSIYSIRDFAGRNFLTQKSNENLNYT